MLAESIEMDAEPVARAVAASSAFPPIFAPLRPRFDQNNASNHHLLTDGGVFDNSGVQYLCGIHKDNRQSDKAGLIILSDAGRAFTTELDREFGSIFTLGSRVTDAQGNRIAEFDSHVAAAFFRNRKIPVMPCSIHHRIRKTQCPDNHSSLVQERLGKIRTELDRFSDEEVFVLYRHGYLVAQQAFDREHSLLNAGTMNGETMTPWVPGPTSLNQVADSRLEHALKDSDTVRKFIWLRWLTLVAISVILLSVVTICGLLIVALRPPSKPDTRPIVEDPKPQFETLSSFRFVVIPAGKFEMGGTDGDVDSEPDEIPRHTVQLREFRLSEEEVTNEQWRAVFGEEAFAELQQRQQSWLPETRLAFRNERAVRGIKWIEAVEFCNRLSAMDGRKPFYLISPNGGRVDVFAEDWDGNGYRLPTEAEWEYACRAGSQGRFGKFTTEIEIDNLSDVAWFTENSGDENASHSQPLLKKARNLFGLYNMHGGIWEWCWDEKRDYSNDNTYRQLTSSQSTAIHVIRGGSFTSKAKELRCSNREFSVGMQLHDDSRKGQLSLDGHLVWVGFRIAHSIGQPEDP